MSHYLPSQLDADDAPEDWGDDLHENVVVAAEREALKDAMAHPAPVPTMVPLGRVLAVACLVPILAMIVLGASRIAIPTIGVGGAATPAEPDVAPEGSQVLPSRAGALATEIYSETASEIAPEGYLIEQTVMMEVTAYCPCVKCCGKQARGITASGKPVTHAGGRFVAADTRLLPFGSMISVPGYHEESPVEVIDRGGAIKGEKIDVFFPTHEAAREWGRQLLPVKFLKPIDSIADAPETGDDLD